MVPRLVWIMALAAVIIALFLSPLASPAPDGLERVLLDHQAAAQAENNPLPAPLPDYTLPGLGEHPLSTALAGAIGVALVLAASLALDLVLRRKEKRDATGQPRLDR